MSAHTSSTEELPGGTAQPEKAPRAWRILALVAVCLGVAALAAATFVLSYSGIRAVALQAGITPRLARGYPPMVDAMLVIALAAVLALRSAGLPSKVLAWLTLLVVLAAAAGADALHAAGRKLPHNPAAITAAVLPWALVLIAFALLLAMLRHARLRRIAPAYGAAGPDGPDRTGLAERSANMPTLELPVRQPPPSGSTPIGPRFLAPPAAASPAVDSPEVDSPEVDSPAIVSRGTVQPVLTVPRQSGPVGMAASGPGAGSREQELPDLAVEADLAPDDPSTDEAAAEPADGTTPYPAESLPLASYDQDATDSPAAGVPAGDAPAGDAPTTGGEADAARTPATAKADEPDPDMPVFHRMWSSPTPPAEK
jgi:Protein of unknown function (DUF2637)